ncbi:MAG TPA: tripartite tricarboxylate transporter substrate binding protein [Xanthobacteraceae bacterium]|jgi:tripartite-type tricarboxylate transporter receptor subunit TctC
MRKRLRAVFMLACVAASALAAPLPAFSQDWPQRQIRIIVSFGPGGGADIIGRILAEGMQERFGKPVIVENKPGAGGIVGNDSVAKAAPDGHTLGIMTAGQIIAAVTRKSMPYATEALTPVARVADASLIIAARPDFPANDARELVRLAKADPGKIVFASPGFAATQHFAGELFKQIAGADLLHVPYRTTPEAIAAVLGKQADVLFDTVSALIGQVQSGSLKALAVTGKDRFPAVPDVPAAIESGVLPGYDVTTWYGVFGPPDMPGAVVARLNHTLMELIQEDKVRQRLAGVGVVVRGSTAEQFGAFMADESKRWDAVREAAGIAQQ